MEREDYLRFCRYKGENDSPYKSGIDPLLWDYERAWVEWSLSRDNYLARMLTDYLNAGLRGFENMDNTPLTLKALLYNRYDHWNQVGPEGFKRWYREVYMS